MLLHNGNRQDLTPRPLVDVDSPVSAEVQAALAGIAGVLAVRYLPAARSSNAGSGCRRILDRPQHRQQGGNI